MKNKLQQFTNKKLAFIGFGAENKALLKFLLKHKVACQLTICDLHDNLKENNVDLAKFKNVTWQLGESYQANLAQFDILFRSPGCPLACSAFKQAQQKNKKIIIHSPMKLFFELCPTKNIIGVTGSKGKGTTSSLIFQLLKDAKKQVYFGGNIGIAPFAFFDKLKTTSWVVLELSSFQLEDLIQSPKIAVITNIFREHLAPADVNNPNFHKTPVAYWQAKSNIFKWQKRSDSVIVNTKLKNKFKKLRTNGKLYYFTKSKLKTKLPGDHNLENIAAVEIVAKIIGLKKELVAKTVAKFTSLEHRLEFVRTINGVDYYDDSFATNPDATMIAIKAFTKPIILLAGGADKASDFKPLAKLIKQKIKFTILLAGAATPHLEKNLLQAGVTKQQFKQFTVFTEAMDYAKKLAVSGDIILLSTACASFGMFKNYKERGNRFKEECLRQEQIVTISTK